MISYRLHYYYYGLASASASSSLYFDTFIIEWALWWSVANVRTTQATSRKQ